MLLLNQLQTILSVVNAQSMACTIIPALHVCLAAVCL
jgi:hypothetical protein